MKALKVVSAFCLGGGRDVYEGRILHVGKDVTPKRAEELVANNLCIEVDIRKEKPRGPEDPNKTQAKQDPSRGSADPTKPGS